MHNKSLAWRSPNRHQSGGSIIPGIRPSSIFVLVKMRRTSLQLEKVHGVIIQICLPAVVALSRAGMLMPGCVLHLVEFCAVLQCERDKAGAQPMRRQAFQA